eukprot:4625196-Prorocentrum_lima.AAC.1
MSTRLTLYGSYGAMATWGQPTARPAFSRPTSSWLLGHQLRRRAIRKASSSSSWPLSFQNAGAPRALSCGA